MNLDTLLSLVGDIPVSEQIAIAIDNHTHKDYVNRNEVEDLKKKIDLLLQLVGDKPVSDQIATALNNMK